MFYETKKELNQSTYPNLVAEYYAGNNAEALARGANTSKEIMMDVLKSEDELTLIEKISLANYIFVNPLYLFSPCLSVLSNKNNKHKVWIKKLNDDLYYIWEAQKSGNKIADDFMKSRCRTDLVKIVLWFEMRDDYYNQFVTYAAYRMIRQETDWYLMKIKEKKQEPRKTKIRQSVNA